MEILRRLHSSVAKSCEGSFDNAYKDLQHELDRCEASVKEAEHRALIASQAQRAAEITIQELQREVSVLREDMKCYEVDPSELELPREYADLEEEFAPKHIWKSDHDHAHPDADISQEVVEAKYTALYSNLQTFIQTWSGLKARVLQHKKKLRQWDKQLERDEFTLVLKGVPVTFCKVQNNPRGVAESKNEPQSSSSICNRLQLPRQEVTEGSLHAENTSVSSLSQAGGPNGDPHIKVEVDSQKTIRDEQLGPLSTQPSSPRCDLTSSGLCPDVLTTCVQSQKRKRTPPPTHPRHDSLSHGHPRDEVPQHAVSIKKELMPSSPVRYQPYWLGQLPPGTQDLDDIGSTVQTPTKRRISNKDIYSEEPPFSCPQQFQRDRQVPQQPTVLQPLDGNARTANSRGQQSGSKRRKNMDKHVIFSLAEDGEEESRDVSMKEEPPKNTSATETGPLKTNAVGKIAQRRLQDLLEGSTPSKSRLVSPGRNEDTTPQSKRKLRETSLPGEIPLPPDHNIANPNDEPPEVHPEDEPYRTRPLHRLNLSHFKINPARNQGLDFAYHAVVRKKDARKCLAGCTRPGCCGDNFRAVVRLGGLPSGPAGAEQEEDQSILEEYLGGDKHLIGRLNAEDRNNLLVEARARVFANQYGRHRHNHHRARSPPGFWRTEMPDTQELESDREAAKRLEREKVEERYREAMRPGGMWTWADE